MGNFTRLFSNTMFDVVRHTEPTKREPSASKELTIAAQIFPHII